MMKPLRLIAGFVLLTITLNLVSAQEKSVRPGINDSFQNPDVKKYAGTFEGESREVSVKRKEILAAVGLKPGDSIADIGAGTGLFTRLFAAEVGPKGKVYAVDIAEKFLDHITKTNKEAGINNVKTVLCKPYSTELTANCIDVAFICDTYHHFEFPSRTMASIHQALKPGGRVVLIDFRRVQGKSSEWTMNHVRAGQEVFEKEIIEAGFKKVSEEKEILKENYLVVFQKVDQTSSNLQFPIIKGNGGVYPVIDAAEQPAKGTKVVFDVTGVGTEVGKPVPALERAAVLLNLAGLNGLKETDLEITLVLHGDATMAALDDKTYQAKFARANENAELIQRLKKAGVKVLVCGQSVMKKGFKLEAVRSEVTIAASALTAVLNHQQRGFASIRSN
jgi:predicted methyltransferase